MPAPAFLVDEMLGRLARYLRFVGCDVVYARGEDDDALVRQAGDARRVLVTRDRALAARLPGSLLLESGELGAQWRAVRRAWPSVPTDVAFRRCSVCNGVLARPAAVPLEAEASGVPEPVRAGGEPLYRCETCGKLYWDGSHTARIRETIAGWEARGPP